MKMMSKPSKPKRKSWEEDIHIGYESLQYLIDMLPDGIDFSEVRFDYSKETYDSRLIAAARYTRHESDEDFAARMASYEVKLSEYNKWYKENEAEIEADRKDQERKAEFLREKKRKAQIVDLKKKLAELEECDGSLV